MTGAELPVAEARAGDKTVRVGACPYCGKPHEHPSTQGFGIREAPCGRGRYRLLLTGGAPSTPPPATRPSTPRAIHAKKTGKSR